MLLVGLSLGALANAGFWAPPAAARHGWGFYNTDMPLLVNGALVEVNYTNPHPEVAIEVVDDAELDPGSLPV